MIGWHHQLNGHESEQTPGGGHGNSFQYSCLENPTDRGAWQATTVHGVTKSQTQLKQLSTRDTNTLYGKIH